MSDSGGRLATTDGSRPLDTGKLISTYYLEIEYLLERVEGATSHYQTLGVERSANSEEVISAYQETINVLHPPYYKVRAAVTDDMLVRVDRAFKKASEAFAVLTDTEKRTEYNRSVNARIYATVPLDTPRPQSSEHNSTSAAGTGPQHNGKIVSTKAVEINVAPELRPVFTKAREETVERRRCERFKLSVPVLAGGYDADGVKWQEVTKSVDVSRIGVAIALRKRVKHGLLVHVTLPLPVKLRSHGFSEAGYNMYAIVRRVEPLVNGTRLVGLEFIGATPPSEYLHNPSATFRTQKWNGPDRRREPREERTESVAVEYLDEATKRIAREAAVTEDVSSGGTRVRVKSAPSDFEFVRITCPKRGFISLALLRNRWTGSDGFERLCLQFVDQKWPS